MYMNQEQRIKHYSDLIASVFDHKVYDIRERDGILYVLKGNGDIWTMTVPTIEKVVIK